MSDSTGRGNSKGGVEHAATTDRTVVRRFALVGIVLPAVLTVGALVAQLSWLPDTPDPIAVHWGVGGADGSGPRWVYPLLTVLLGFGMAGWLWGTALARVRRGARGWSFRFLAAMSLGMATFGAIAMTYSVSIQVGLDSWRDAPNIALALLVAAGIGIAAGLVGWFVQPAQTSTFDELPSAHVALAEGERAVWLGVAKSGPALVMAVILGIILVAAAAVVSWIAGEFGVMWMLLGLAILLTALALSMLEADVRVDATGVDVRGPVGFPRIRVALANVASAQAIDLEAMGSFGGFGWRRRPGAQGVVMRSGEALRIVRVQGPDLVITVDDAATAAALLNALKVGA